MKFLVKSQVSFIAFVVLIIITTACKTTSPSPAIPPQPSTISPSTPNTLPAAQVTTAENEVVNELENEEAFLENIEQDIVGLEI